MGEIAARLMEVLHGSNIYAGFSPMFPLDLQGWNSQHPIFRDAIAQLRPSIIIDAGVWKGASTIFLADLLREAGIDGGVIAIDTFLGGAERSEYYLRQHGRPLLYEQFLSNVLHSNATDRIVPVPQTTYFASIILKSLGIRAGMIHIDASHEYEDVLRIAGCIGICWSRVVGSSVMIMWRCGQAWYVPPMNSRQRSTSS